MYKRGSGHPGDQLVYDGWYEARDNLTTHLSDRKQ
jgi:hypothetical protein